MYYSVLQDATIKLVAIASRKKFVEKILWSESRQFSDLFSVVMYQAVHSAFTTCVYGLLQLK